MLRPRSLRDIAQSAGRAPSYVGDLARAGLLPGYSGSSPRLGAEVPPELAEPFETVVRSGLGGQKLAALMREDPDSVVAAAEALLVLGQHGQRLGHAEGDEVVA